MPPAWPPRRAFFSWCSALRVLCALPPVPGAKPAPPPQRVLRLVACLLPPGVRLAPSCRGAGGGGVRRRASRRSVPLDWPQLAGGTRQRAPWLWRTRGGRGGLASGLSSNPPMQAPAQQRKRSPRSWHVAARGARASAAIAHRCREQARTGGATTGGGCDRGGTGRPAALPLPPQRLAPPPPAPATPRNSQSCPRLGTVGVRAAYAGAVGGASPELVAGTTGRAPRQPPSRPSTRLQPRRGTHCKDGGR